MVRDDIIKNNLREGDILLLRNGFARMLCKDEEGNYELMEASRKIADIKLDSYNTDLSHKESCLYDVMAIVWGGYTNTIRDFFCEKINLVNYNQNMYSYIRKFKVSKEEASRKLTELYGYPVEIDDFAG